MGDKKVMTEKDKDTGVVKRKGWNVVRGQDLPNMAQQAVMDKIARVEAETREKEGRHG